MYGWRSRIGLIVPSSNTTMESEFWKMAPKGVSVHTARMNLTDVTEEALIKMESYAKAAAMRLADAAVDIIMYGCTSGSLLKGKGYDRQISQELERHSGIKTVTTSTAVLEALKELEISKLAVATPYIDDVNAKEKQFLEENGIEIVRMEGLGLIKNIEIGKQEPQTAYNLAKRIYTPNADGIFISCTNFRTIEVIDLLEMDLGVPVITSNQASMWFALRNLGIKEKYKEYGALMKERL
ncbi:maleate cis-trans isomerase family protein [Thermococcus sp.]